MNGDGPFELTTKRCVLRPIADADAETLHALWSSPGVRRFLWDDERIPTARTRAAIEQSRELFAERRFGLWGAWRRDRPALAGFGALWPFRAPPEFELLYGVAENEWGQGYAGEIADAVIGYCFTSLGMPAVRASTDAGNAASIRVLEKLGFGFVRREVVGGLDTVFYELLSNGRAVSNA
jgi:RimJ/RimL family protein N-acetyltransferase